MGKGRILILLIFLAALSVWAKGDHDINENGGYMLDNECEGIILARLCGIEVSGPLQKGDFHLIVGALEMKESYKKYVGHVLDDKTTVVTPLINLDLYGQSRDGKIIPIQRNSLNEKIEVNVSIPIRLITSKTDVKNIDDIKLYFYIPERKGWVEFKELTDVSNLKRDSDSIDFTITEWPIDDRMIGSGP